MTTMGKMLFRTLIGIALLMPMTMQAGMFWQSDHNDELCDKHDSHYMNGLNELMHHHTCEYKVSQKSFENVCHHEYNMNRDRCDHGCTGCDIDERCHGDHDNRGTECSGSHTKHNRCDHGCTGCDIDQRCHGDHDNRGTECGAPCHITHDGKIKGVIFEDVNNNGQFDQGIDKRLQGVKVTVTDVEGMLHTVETNHKGKFCVKHLSDGEVVVDINESTLPVGSSIVLGADQFKINVMSDKKMKVVYYGYTCPDPTGNVFGNVFEDKNGNMLRDSGEVGMMGIGITLVDANGEIHTTVTDRSGDYTFDNIVAGQATVTVDPSSLPCNAELVVGDNPSEIDVKANEDNDAGIDGYTILIQTYGNVTGFVFEDRDSNGVYDSYDLPITGLTVVIQTLNGDEFSVVTDSTGHYTAEDIPTGQVTVTVDDANITAQYPDAVQTAGDNPTTVTVEADTTVDAGEDAFNFMDGGLITGRVYKDVDKDGVYTEGVDEPMENIRVTQEDETDTDSAVTESTDASGIWFAYIKKPQDTDITVTLNTTDIRDQYGNLIISSGQNPTYLKLNVGVINNIGEIGWYKNTSTR